VKISTWEELLTQHCTIKNILTGNTSTRNPFYEDMACRRYNYTPVADTDSVRLVFLQDVLKDESNKTLIRKGRFIWCKNLKYEGRSNHTFRKISFTVDKGKKRFTVSENNILCIPSNSFVNNNRFFRTRQKTFTPFSSVFGYKNTLKMMSKNSDLDHLDFVNLVDKESPYRPGTLVAPRLGYFYPEPNPNLGTAIPLATDEEHPYGIIIGPSFQNSHTFGREFYRVKFGGTTYERVHPVQMEVVNEV